MAAASSAVDDDALSISAESSVCFPKLPAAGILHFSACWVLKDMQMTLAVHKLTFHGAQMSSHVLNGVQHIAYDKLTRFIYVSELVSSGVVPGRSLCTKSALETSQ